MYNFEGDTASQVWTLAFETLRDDKNVSVQPSRNGTTREILHALFSIRNPIERWTSVRHPALNPAFAIAEVWWIVGGRQDARFLTYWNNQLTRFIGTADNLYGAYGHRLRYKFGIDQLEQAYRTLDSNPDGRQVVLQIWDPRSDLPVEDGKPRDSDIPCNTGAYLKIRDNKLEWMQLNRSNDLYLGVPHNFIQFTSLQEIMTGWLGIEIGSYSHLSDSLHVYVNDAETVDVNRNLESAYNNDILRFSKSEFEKYSSNLTSWVEKMTANEVSLRDLTAILSGYDAPQAFHNQMLIFVAEYARRKGWNEISIEAGEKCTNSALKQAWHNWHDRMIKNKPLN